MCRINDPLDGLFDDQFRKRWLADFKHCEFNRRRGLFWLDTSPEDEIGHRDLAILVTPDHLSGDLELLFTCRLHDVRLIVRIRPLQFDTYLVQRLQLGTGGDEHRCTVRDMCRIDDPLDGLFDDQFRKRWLADFKHCEFNRSRGLFWLDTSPEDEIGHRDLAILVTPDHFSGNLELLFTCPLHGVRLIVRVRPLHFDTYLVLRLQAGIGAYYNRCTVRDKRGINDPLCSGLFDDQLRKRRDSSPDLQRQRLGVTGRSLRPRDPVRRHHRVTVVIGYQFFTDGQIIMFALVVGSGDVDPVFQRRLIRALPVEPQYIAYPDTRIALHHQLGTTDRYLFGIEHPAAICLLLCVVDTRCWQLSARFTDIEGDRALRPAWRQTGPLQRIEQHQFATLDRLQVFAIDRERNRLLARCLTVADVMGIDCREVWLQVRPFPLPDQSDHIARLHTVVPGHLDVGYRQRRVEGALLGIQCLRRGQAYSFALNGDELASGLIAAFSPLLLISLDTQGPARRLRLDQLIAEFRLGLGQLAHICIGNADFEHRRHALD